MSLRRNVGFYFVTLSLHINFGSNLTIFDPQGKSGQRHIHRFLILFFIGVLRQRVSQKFQLGSITGWGVTVNPKTSKCIIFFHGLLPPNPAPDACHNKILLVSIHSVLQCSSFSGETSVGPLRCRVIGGCLCFLSLYPADEPDKAIRLPGECRN